MFKVVVWLGTGLCCSGCVMHEFTADISHKSQASHAVGHCFELRIDTYVNVVPTTAHLGQDTLSFDGNFQHDPGTPHEQGMLVPRGSRFVAEKVVSTYYPQVGHFLSTYVRLGPELGGGLIDATSLFRTTYGTSDPVLPIDTFLDSCD